MKLAVAVEIGAVAIDRLLKIADHAEVAGSRRILVIVRPQSCCRRWPGNFQKHGELRRLGVLGFIENDAIIFFANASRGFRVTHRFNGQRYLIAIVDCALLKAELAIILLHFGGDAGRTHVDPFAQRPEGFAP